MDLIVLIMAAFNSAACSCAKAMLRILSVVASCICWTLRGEVIRLGSFADAGMKAALPAKIRHFFRHLMNARYIYNLTMHYCVSSCLHYHHGLPNQRERSWTGASTCTTRCETYSRPSLPFLANASLLYNFGGDVMQKASEERSCQVDIQQQVPS